MGIDALFTLFVVGLVLALLVFTRRSPDMILIAGLTLLMVTPLPVGGRWQVGVMSVADAVSGASNPGMLTVGVLFVVAAGVRETGGMAWIGQRLLGRPRSALGAQMTIMPPVALMSALLNNTPVVAMFIPVLQDWARKLQFSASKLLIPLSYAAILGGLCTLVGTSTNLVVNGLVMSELGRPSLGMFEIAWIGVPCALVGGTYLTVFGRRLLPDRSPAIEQTDDPRQYTIEMVVQPGSALIGRSIEKAGLRHLPGVYLAEIERDGHLLTAVGPEQVLQAHDRLVFVGVVDSMRDLQQIRGLEPATDQVFKLNAPRSQRCLIEAVVSNTNPLLGKTIRQGRFRTVYDAVVIAVTRNGERIDKKVGDIVLRAGDTLLLETAPTFAEQHRNRRDFYLVRPVEGSTPLRHDKAWLALGILLGMVALVTLNLLTMLQAAMLAAGLMILTRCLTGVDARQSVDWALLAVIAASFGIGRAMDVTGAAAFIADHLIALAAGNPMLTLLAVYLVTSAFTEMITNNAAAVLVFPIAVAAAARLGVDPMPFIMTIMIAASASFASPIGYQTNLMVYGPGGYRFTDYLRIGLPLNVLMCLTTVLLVPHIWPFGE